MFDLIDALRDHVAQLALELLGEASRRLSTKTTWRYGRKGSLAIEVSGPKHGWTDR
jgi:hypothetical protein